MQSEVKVSVIMPVYNSEKYLGKAVESVLNQTFKEFELILVDDGATDCSGNICDEYAQSDNRIRVIHKENGGISSARNAGLKAAKGEYIAFCDNDDLYLPNLLRDNYELVKKYDADIIRFKRLKISTKKDGRTVKTTDELKRFAYLNGREEIGKNYALIRSSYTAVWMGLYRKDFIRNNKIHFPQFMKHGQEDDNFIYNCYLHMSSIVLNPKIYYYWQQRDEHSTSAKIHKNWIDSIVYNMRLEWSLIDELGTYKYWKESYFVCVKSCLWWVYAYIFQKGTPYNILQRATIIREVCGKIPDPSLLRAKGEKDKLVRAIQKKNVISIFKILKKEGAEW